MAVFRVERNKGYTVTVSYTHLTKQDQAAWTHQGSQVLCQNFRVSRGGSLSRGDLCAGAVVSSCDGIGQDVLPGQQGAYQPFSAPHAAVAQAPAQT